MTNKYKLHDSEIIGLNYFPENQSLSLCVLQPDNKKIVIEIRSVIGWELSEFKMQNVLFEFTERDCNTASVQMVNDYEVDPFYIEKVQKYAYKYFFLDSSVGLSGYIIGKECTMEEIPI